MIMYSDIAVHNAKCLTVEGFQAIENTYPNLNIVAADYKESLFKKDLFFT